jgi:hypothetical protein
MHSKDQVTGFAVAWAALHLIGLAMYLDGRTGRDYPAYGIISSIWQIEAWILVVGLVTLAIFFISHLCLHESGNPPDRSPKNINPLPSEKVGPSVEPYFKTIPPPPKPPDPTPDDLKEKAISQILGRRNE